MGPLVRIGVALALLMLAGCGSGDDTAAQPSQPRYDLTVTLWPQGLEGPSRTASLTCDPDGGTHPDPTKACSSLLAHPEALHPVPPDVACTMVYGGDQVARIEGAGLVATFRRANGCEIARWDALAPLLELSG